MKAVSASLARSIEHPASSMPWEFLLKSCRPDVQARLDAYESPNQSSTMGKFRIGSVCAEVASDRSCAE